MKKILIFILCFSSGYLRAQTETEILYQSNSNIPAVIVESNNSDCVRLRPDIWDFSQSQREDLLDCMMSYLETGTNTSWQNTDPRQESNFIVLEHFDNLGSWHNNEEIGFFTGHREYLKGMEEYLINTPGCESFVPLPAFNPGPSGGGIPNEFVSSESVLDNFPSFDVFEGSSAELNQMPNLPQLIVNEETCTQQIFGSAGNLLYDFRDIDDFANYVESGPGQHNEIHAEIGGIMGNPHWSPASAIFWLWHAYVDDTYRCYQQICQCEQHEANYDFDNCLICLETNEIVTGNNSLISFSSLEGELLNISTDENLCINMQELEVGVPIVSVENGSICPKSHLQLINSDNFICSCSPTEVYAKDCTVCFESVRLNTTSDETTWSFSDANGLPLTIVLDENGCIDMNLSQGLPPGKEIQVQIEGSICPTENLSIKMPIETFGEDSKFGNSCVQMEIYPQNPVSPIFTIDLLNNGEEEKVAVYRINEAGDYEELMSPTILKNKESYRINSVSTHWGVGMHVIHVYYGSIIVAGKVMKL